MTTDHTYMLRLALRHVLLGSAALGLTSFVGMSASAADIAFDASLGMGHSDNIRRQRSNERSESIAAAGLLFSVDENTRRLKADAVGNFSYAEYLNNTYDAELLGNFAGNARFGIVPERFEWVVSDNYGQVLSDPFAPPSPNNRENVNYFSTGPDLTAAFGAQNRIRLGGRYSIATFEDSPLDSNTKMGDLSLIRLLSSTTNVSLNGSVQQIQYDRSALNADYDQYETFVRYDTMGARTNVKLDLGYTKINRDAVAKAEDGLLLRLDAARRVSAASTATLTAGREFSNAAAAFSSTQGVGQIGLGALPGRQTAQPFVNDYATVGWTYSRDRNSLFTTAGWSQRNYDGASELDQTLLTVSGQYRRELSPRTSLTLLAEYANADFKGQGDYKDLRGGAAFAWRFTRVWSATASVTHFRRNAQISATDYSENQVWLSIVYSHGTPRVALQGPDFGNRGQ